MTKIFAGLGAAAALAVLGGCAYDHGDHYGYHHDRGMVSAGYYDGYYGPYHDGYWASDGSYYYQGADGQSHRDDGHHFRRDQADGYQPVVGLNHDDIGH